MTTDARMKGNAASLYFWISVVGTIEPRSFLVMLNSLTVKLGLALTNHNHYFQSISRLWIPCNGRMLTVKVGKLFFRNSYEGENRRVLITSNIPKDNIDDSESGRVRDET